SNTYTKPKPNEKPIVPLAQVSYVSFRSLSAQPIAIPPNPERTVTGNVKTLNTIIDTNIVAINIINECLIPNLYVYITNGIGNKKTETIAKNGIKIVAINNTIYMAIYNAP